MKSKLDDAVVASGMSQTEIAAKCGISLSTFSLWLRRSRSGGGSLPDGERAKLLELVLCVKDFRALFPHDWPEV